MLVTKLQLKNMMVFKDLEIEPGVITEISGPNGSGKTSVIEPLKNLIDGGQDVSLIRRGEKTGEVALTLDDKIQFRKVHGKGKPRLTVQGDVDGTAKAALDALVDSVAANPLEFVHADPERQADIFLETVPLHLEPGDLARATGIPASEAEALLSKATNPLDVIADLGKRSYDERTGVNRAAKEKRATVTQLTQAIPEGTADEAEKRLVELRYEQRAIDQEKKHAEIAALLQAERDVIHSDYDEAAVQAEKKYAEAIRAAEETRAEILTVAGKVRQELLDQKKSEANEQYKTWMEETREKREQIAGEVGRLDEQIKQLRRAEGTAETIETLKAEVGFLEEKSAKLTEDIKAFDALREKLTGELPIPGMLISGKEVTVDGIPFHRLNTEHQYRIALKIMVLRAQDKACKFIFVDGMEHLDQAHYEAFKSAALKYGEQGYQFLVTRVSDGPFEVKTEG
jgi:energy-coupling factor transporter ATP-binding protein EcfA2